MGKVFRSLIALACAVAVLAADCEGTRPEGALEGAIFDKVKEALDQVTAEPIGEQLEAPPIPWTFGVGLPGIPRAVSLDPTELGEEGNCVDPGASPGIPTEIPLPTQSPGQIIVPVVTKEISWELFESGRTIFEGQDYSVTQTQEGAEEAAATFTTLPTIVALGSDRSSERFINIRIVVAARLEDAPQLATCDVDPEVEVRRGLTLSVDKLFGLTKPYLRELPVVLGLAQHDDFQGGILLLVPKRMPFVNKDPGTQEVSRIRALTEPLFDELGKAQEELDSIRGTVQAAGFLLNLLVGLDTLRAAAAASNVRLTVVDEIPDMNVDDPEDGAPYQEAFSLCVACGTLGNDIESNDEVSSLFLLGAGGERVSLFGDQNFDSGEGQLDITVHATGFFVAIRDLGFADFLSPRLVDDPTDIDHLEKREVVGAGEVTLCEPDEDDDWEDSFSSLRFFGAAC